MVELKNKTNPNQIDKIICAKIPDKKIGLLLFDNIDENMIYGPSGSSNKNLPCMNMNGKKLATTDYIRLSKQRDISKFSTEIYAKFKIIF